ncbi:C4-dicarboxylate ABC transporter permease [Skermanella stibiiresistens SB22]|uniref:TRAP transporter small permease protein n=1 Tax=Skermanella stibiiresistens SB22 TaxID=1385369 RepID=W9H1H5_9PROT|nr:TRAP transporter small permease [Skermanella stibiiresistens]EWY38641.1 C4-dicarboxylate ABC transporter permease [Skermanella stibiiresistens SB22]
MTVRHPATPGSATPVERDLPTIPDGILSDKQDASLFSLRRADEAVGTLCLLVIVGSILWGVLSRYLFPQPAAWAYELSVIAFAYLVFFGAVAGVRLGSHAAIDVLVTTFPIRAQRAVDWFNYLLLAGFFVLMAILFAWQTVIGHGARTVALDLPRSIVYGPLALASVGMLVQHLIVERPWAPRQIPRNTESII